MSAFIKYILSVNSLPFLLYIVKYLKRQQSLSSPVFFSLLRYSDFFDIEFISLQQIGVFALAAGADLCVLYSLVFFSAVFAVGDGRYGLDLQNGMFHQGFFFYCPVPAVDQIFVEYAGDLSDLQRDTFYPIFLCYFFHVPYYVKYNAQFFPVFNLQIPAHEWINQCISPLPGSSDPGCTAHTNLFLSMR